jgi:hypothetical protein
VASGLAVGAAEVEGRRGVWESLRALGSGLGSDPRLPRWVWRGVAAASAGIILAIVANWEFGIGAALFSVGAHAFYSSRTSAVIPASVRAGSAQRRTRHRLARLAQSGYLSLHGRLVPDAGLVIEHLVAGPAGVYVVGSRRWDRRLPVRATHRGQLFHGPFDESAGLGQARRQAEHAARRIGDALGQAVTVRPALVIYGPRVPWFVMRIDGVDVVAGSKLRKYLRREAAANRAARLTDRQIEVIHAVAAQAFPPAR